MSAHSFAVIHADAHDMSVAFARQPPTLNQGVAPQASFALVNGPAELAPGAMHWKQSSELGALSFVAHAEGSLAPANKHSEM
jgi:hypothetical protein